VRTDGHATYVVGDVHGHLDQLLGALADAGLVDDEATWAGGETHLWFLGDFVDRGPDGIGVIEFVMRLAKEAEKAGGYVEALLGNHEILMLGTHRFGDTEVPSEFGQRSFARSWEMNGGQLSDQEAVTDEHIEWLSSRPALALVDEHLLMHSDTVEYLVWGADIEEINAGIQQVLRGDDLAAWWEVWRRLTTRHAFRGPQGSEVAVQLLNVLGGEQLVHGHSVIADQLGVMPADIDTPFEYAGGLALGVDAGVFVGGPCLVVRLPFEPEVDGEVTVLDGEVEVAGPEVADPEDEAEFVRLGPLEPAAEPVPGEAEPADAADPVAADTEPAAEADPDTAPGADVEPEAETDAGEEPKAGKTSANAEDDE
jgi:calcineurin-like phosphoesterase family protein